MGLTFITSIATNGTSGNTGPNSDPPGDNQLIIAYKQSSDLRVLAQLYEPYMPLVYGVCLKYLGERETARDAVMDIFEELVQRLLKHDVSSFKGWLYALAKNHCLMKLRSAGRTSFQPFDPEHMQTAEDLHLKDKMEAEEQFHRLSKCIESLSADQKTVIQLFYLENKCYKEIETATGMEWNKVRSHIQNGRRNLKLCMQKQETGRDPALIVSDE